MSSTSEVEEKLSRITTLLESRGLDAVVMKRAANFAWATGGASSFIHMATTEGEATLVITPSGRYVIANEIEAPRLEYEERLSERGWKIVTHAWYRPGDILQELTQGLKIGADVPLPGAKDLAGSLSRVRARLLPEEGDRFRQLGRLCADAMAAAVQSTRPGQTEHEIASHMARELFSRGTQAVVLLVATDERIFRFRHPLSTEKKLDRYAMLILCGRKWGLVCSVTRLVHFGALPDKVRRTAESTARVDAAFIIGTRPGRLVSNVFAEGVAAYATEGYADEWQLHHQGGAAGYEPREFLGRPGETEEIVEGQAYAWNPSITGTKSEDTILVGANINEVITAIPGWPVIDVEVGGRTIERPEILVNP